METYKCKNCNDYIELGETYCAYCERKELERNRKYDAMECGFDTVDEYDAGFKFDKELMEKYIIKTPLEPFNKEKLVNDMIDIANYFVDLRNETKDFGDENYYRGSIDSLMQFIEAIKKGEYDK